MTATLDGKALSDRLADLAAGAAPWVVRVDGRRRGPASGAVWSADGTVVTTSHALERDEEIEVGLEGGETVAAALAGRDPATDLAVLRVKRTGLAAPAWAESARPGELVLGLSRPGRSLRASLGVVARVGGEFRTAQGGRVERWIELDLGLRPGFSGGLAVDTAGRALGLAAGGLVRGTALCVPPETLRRVVGAILSHGALRRGFLGLAGMPVRLPAAAVREAGQEHGLLLTAIEEGGPAERAGLVLGDVVLSAEGRPLSHAGELLPFLEEDRIGAPLLLRTWRAGAARDVRVVVGVRERGRP